MSDAERPYLCSYCDHRFGTEGGLFAHSLISCAGTSLITELALDREPVYTMLPLRERPSDGAPMLVLVALYTADRPDGDCERCGVAVEQGEAIAHDELVGAMYHYPRCADVTR